MHFRRLCGFKRQSHGANLPHPIIKNMAIGSHIIPRFYLEQFANPAKRKNGSGWVWVYEKGKKPRQSATKAQGYENGYFAFVHPDGRRDESFETRLAELENRCNDELVCAKSRFFDLSAIHRTTLAFYMGLLFARSTSRRRFSAGNWAKLKGPFAQLEFNETYVADTAAHFSETTGEEVTPEQIRQMIRKQAERCTDKEMAGNSFIEDLLFHAEMVKSELVPRMWQVWEAPAGAEFVTSDNPVVTFIRLKEDLWHPGYGFRKPGVVVTLPITSTACLTVGFAGQPEFQPVVAATVARMNDIVVRCSDRFVYSKTLHDETKNMVDEVGRTSVPGETAFVGPFADTQRIEEHLRKSMGILKRAANPEK
jgi:Protein of unknown function (DUF4238)